MFFGEWLDKEMSQRVQGNLCNGKSLPIDSSFYKCDNECNRIGEQTGPLAPNSVIRYVGG